MANGSLANAEKKFSSTSVMTDVRQLDSPMLLRLSRVQPDFPFAGDVKDVWRINLDVTTNLRVLTEDVISA